MKVDTKKLNITMKNWYACNLRSYKLLRLPSTTCLNMNKQHSAGEECGVREAASVRVPVHHLLQHDDGVAVQLDDLRRDEAAGRQEVRPRHS